MSDDEDFYDDDEWLWVEDGVIDPIDDLTYGLVQSPVYFEHPSFDTAEQFSDWEYYSDDYFDDDPSILQRQEDGSTKSDSHKEREHRNTSQRGQRKRRKLAAAENIPDLSLGESAGWSTGHSPFLGVMWKKSHPSTEKVQSYEPGQGEKVALLKNWREVFKESQPKSGKGVQSDAANSVRSRSTRGTRQPPKKTARNDYAGNSEDAGSGSISEFTSTPNDVAETNGARANTQTPPANAVSEQDLDMSSIKRTTRSRAKRGLASQDPEESTTAANETLANGPDPPTTARKRRRV